MSGECRGAQLDTGPYRLESPSSPSPARRARVGPQAGECSDTSGTWVRSLPGADSRNGGTFAEVASSDACHAGVLAWGLEPGQQRHPGGFPRINRLIEVSLLPVPRQGTTTAYCVPTKAVGPLQDSDGRSPLLKGMGPLQGESWSRPVCSPQGLLGVRGPAGGVTAWPSRGVTVQSRGLSWSGVSTGGADFGSTDGDVERAGTGSPVARRS